jgi:hypothetical protein
MSKLQYPNQDYYPSCKVRLGIRFDELSRRVFEGKIPPRPLHKLTGIKDARAPLRIVNDTTAPTGTRRILLELDTTKKKLAGLGPQKQVRSDDGLTFVLAGIMPKEATRNQNGVRTADTLNVTLRYIDMPISPLVVRAAWIELYLGTVTPEEYLRGIQGEMRTVNLKGGRKILEPMNLVPDTFVDDAGRVRSNLRFQGFVDKWENQFNEGEPVIRFECRDNTQLLIDIDAPSKLTIDKGIAIDRAIAQYLSHFPQLDGMTVEYRPGNVKETDIPVLKNVYSKASFPPQLGPPPSLANGQLSGLTVWDFLTDVVSSLGHTIRIDNTNIIIERVRTLIGTQTTGKGMQRPEDPFRSRNGRTYRQFIYGRNIAELKSTRSFVRNVPTNIEVRSYDPVKKSPVVARYPTNKAGSGVHTSIPGDGGAEEKWLVWRVAPGITDKDTLRIIAQNIYEQLGRQELQIRLKTKNLASFGGGNQDPDLLDMRPGDSFELLVNRGGDADVADAENSNTVTTIEKQLSTFRERNIEFMKTRGFPDEFAKAYARAYTDIGFQTVFRTKTISTTWSAETGVSIDIEGVNYVEVRAEPLKLPNPPKD